MRKKLITIIFVVALTATMVACSSAKFGQLEPIADSEEAAENSEAAPDADEAQASPEKMLGTDHLTIIPLADYDYSQFYGDEEVIAQGLYDTCYQRVEALAATLAGFPLTVAAANAAREQPLPLQEITPWSLDYFIGTAEGGEETQRWALELLADILHDPETDFEFYRAEDV